MSLRKIALILFAGTVSFVFVSRAQPRDTVRVLFIGNSYIYTNDMPSLFKGMAIAAHRPVYVDASVIGGFSLEQHLNHQPSVDKIRQRRWDFVILQEQSVIPTIPYYRDNSMYPAARRLDAMIRNAGAKTVFFLTWGRKSGGRQTIGTYSSPGFEDYFQMQDSLSTAYRRIAIELSAGICPIGIAWKLALKTDPSRTFWYDGDDSHPSYEGTYLATCTLFSTLLGISPEGNAYEGRPLDSLTTRYYQRLAYHAVQAYGSLIPTFRLWQNFPNPFSRTTTLTFSLPEDGIVTMKLYNNDGQEIATLASGFREMGTSDVSFDAQSLSSGAYFYRLQFGLQAATCRMVVAK